jgi:hypothetical protein
LVGDGLLRGFEFAGVGAVLEGDLLVFGRGMVSGWMLRDRDLE